jgi:heat shock protein HspQ
MQFNNQTTRNVADIAAKILAGETPSQPLNEALKGDQHKIDKNKNNKIDAEDFKILRGEKKMKEETELTESHFKVGDKVKCKTSGMKGEVVKLDKEHGDDDEAYYTVKREDGETKKMAPKDMTKINEDVEQIQEYESKKGSYVHKGTYGYGGKGAEHGETDYKKANADEKMADKKKPARKAYGARQNYVRSYAKESFTGLLDVYREGGMRSLFESLVKEEPDNEEFTKEVERQKRKASGTAPDSEKAKVAKAAVQAVKVEEDVQDIQVIDANKANGVEITDIQERSLTEPEMKKKEEVVKSMKKNLSGFKDRYGDDAKSVMYGTATKIAKKD